MKKSIRLYAVLLTIIFLLGSAPFAAASTEVAIHWAFDGEGAARAGYGEGTITLQGGAQSGNYILYWANDTAVLEDYEKIAALPTSGGRASYQTPQGMAIPSDATKLVAFWSNTEAAASTRLSDAAGCFDLPAHKRFSGNAEFSFASVSDVHLNYTNLGASAKLTAALTFFSDLGLEYVMVSGDITNAGGAADYAAYVDAIEASPFPMDRIYEARGNHDALDITNFLTYTSGAGEVRPYANSPYFHLLLEGDAGEKDNLFIFMTQELTSTSASSNEDNFSDAQLDWVEGLLAQYAGEQTNIFILQHAFFKNWGPGDRTDGAYPQPMLLSSSFTGNLRYKALLEKYKECIVMSGHSHLSLREGQNFSTENGTAARMIHNGSTSQPRVYLSDGTLSYAAATAQEGSEGYAVYVYADDIVYQGIDLSTGQKIPAACYIFPSYTEDRAAASAVRVTKPPQKTAYLSGEKFDAAGMEITAQFADGERVVKGWYCDSETPLSKNDTSVTVFYGDLTARVEITVDKLFAGSGTKEDPFLIQTAQDFKRFTDLFESSIITDSNDAAGSFGYGQYFLQTADIDMRGVAEYEGTDAWGHEKDSFGGVYDGGGHTLWVEIDTDATDGSVFPYVNGIVMNLNFKGRLTAATNAQIIRTLGKNGSLINCAASMTLQSGGKANGLCYSSYGTVLQFYNTSTLLSPTANLCAITHSGDSYIHFYHSITDAAGGAVTGLYGSRTDDVQGVTTTFNDHTKEASLLLERKLQGVGLDLFDLCLWHNGRVTTDRYRVEPPKVQKQALSEEIAAVEGLDLSVYTAASVAALRAALSLAKQTYQNDAATQAQVDQALLALQRAKTEMEIKEELICPTKHFVDVDRNKWYHQSVDFMVSHGYMVGVSDTKFDTMGQVSRAQLVTVLYRLVGSPDTATTPNPFTDVAQNQWFAAAVRWGAANGIVYGVDKTHFAPFAPITREQIVCFLYRFAGEKKESGDYLASYRDKAKVSGYARDAMNWSVCHGYVKGTSDTMLSPQNNASRAELCGIMERYLTKNQVK